MSEQIPDWMKSPFKSYVLDCLRKKRSNKTKKKKMKKGLK